MVMTKPLIECTILDVPITCFRSPAHAATHIVQTIKNKEKTYCVAINPEKVCFAREDVAFGEIVRNATFHICDGIGTAAAVRILWGRKIPRVTGIDLFLQMLCVAEQEDLAVFLLGSRSETIRLARARVEQEHPYLRCVGCRDGYFEDKESMSIIRRINSSEADMLFIALGSPKQERWIAQYRGQLSVPFCMGVGGSFDVLSGRVKRAPWVFRKTGTEWLYRLVQQPSRWSRQRALPRFTLDILRWKLWHHSKIHESLDTRRANPDVALVDKAFLDIPKPAREEVVKVDSPATPVH